MHGRVEEERPRRPARQITLMLCMIVSLSRCNKTFEGLKPRFEAAYVLYCYVRDV